MLSKFEKDLLKITAIGRILVWLISFISDRSIEDHDHSVDLLFKNKDTPDLSIISLLLRCFVRWDALFYVSIAENGYEYLKNHAFFPLYSKLIKLIQDILFAPFSSLKGLDTLLLTGITFNFFLHLANVIIFYR